MIHMPRRLKKDILIVVGVIAMVWGYNQLFTPESAHNYLDLSVGAYAPDGARINGVVTAADPETLTIQSTAKVVTIARKQIVEVEGKTLHAFETARAVRAVIATILGGLVFWLGLFGIKS